MMFGLNVVPDNEMGMHDENLIGGMQCSACGAQPYLNDASGWTTIHNYIEKEDNNGGVQLHGNRPANPQR